MDKRVKTILGIGVLILVIGGAYLAYTLLSGSAETGTLQTQPAAETSAQASSTSSGYACHDYGSTESAEATQTPVAPVNTTADFTMTDADGNPVNLSDFFGKPIVLNFWASWCPPCKAELPDFEKVYKEMGGDVNFVMVNLVDGQRETVESGSGYVAGQGYTFPVYFDVSQEAALAYGINYIPTTYFIDASGQVAAVNEGQINEATLRGGIAMIAP